MIYKTNRFGLANIVNSMGRYSVDKIRAMFLIVKMSDDSVAGADG